MLDSRVMLPSLSLNLKMFWSDCHALLSLRLPFPSTSTLHAAVQAEVEIKIVEDVSAQTDFEDPVTTTSHIINETKSHYRQAGPFGQAMMK